MTPHEPRLLRGVPLPITPISPGDIAVIAEMMGAYLTLVRLSFRASPQRDAYVQYVEDLRRRLAERYAENTALALTMQDIETIEAAMLAFESTMSQLAPPTNERDATIHACACLRQRIALMRSCSPVRRSPHEPEPHH